MVHTQSANIGVFGLGVPQTVKQRELPCQVLGTLQQHTQMLQERVLALYTWPFLTGSWTRVWTLHNSGESHFRIWPCLCLEAFDVASAPDRLTKPLSVATQHSVFLEAPFFPTVLTRESACSPYGGKQHAWRFSSLPKHQKPKAPPHP